MKNIFSKLFFNAINSATTVFYASSSQKVFLSPFEYFTT